MEDDESTSERHRLSRLLGDRWRLLEVDEKFLEVFPPLQVIVVQGGVALHGWGRGY